MNVNKASAFTCSSWLWMDQAQQEKKEKDREKKKKQKIIQNFGHLKMYQNRNDLSLWSISVAKPELCSEDQTLCRVLKKDSVRMKHRDLTFKQVKSLLSPGCPYQSGQNKSVSPIQSHCTKATEDCSRDLWYLGADLLPQQSYCSPTLCPGEMTLCCIQTFCYRLHPKDLNWRADN